MLGIGQENWMRKNIGRIVYMSSPPETPTELAFSPQPKKKRKTSNGHAEQTHLLQGPVEQTPIQRMNQQDDGVPTVHESQHKNYKELYDALHILSFETPILQGKKNEKIM